MSKIERENVNTLDYWNRLHGNADHNTHIFVQSERFFDFNLVPKENVSILDIGCATAQHFPKIQAKYPTLRLFGLDLSQVAIERNRTVYPEFEFYLTDIVKDDIPRNFDYIISSHTFEHFENPTEIIEKCIKAAREFVVICVPYDKNWEGSRDHVYSFTEDEPFRNYEKYIMFNEQEIVFVFKGKASKITENMVFVLDFDGVFTDAKMYYTKEGKVMKCVGCDDWEMIKKLSNYIQVEIISADERGFPITRKRVKEEMNMDLHLVRESSSGRWNWIKSRHPHKHIIYMGDSLGDYYSLKNADFGITVCDALPFTKKFANLVLTRRGGDRAVAEAVLLINDKYQIFDIYELLG